MCHTFNLSVKNGSKLDKVVPHSGLCIDYVYSSYLLEAFLCLYKIKANYGIVISDGNLFYVAHAKRIFFFFLEKKIRMDCSRSNQILKQIK